MKVGLLFAGSPSELWIPRVRLTLRYRGRIVEFFIGISDSDKARISRKRCTTRARYILHSRTRARSRFGEPLVNLRSLFIEIYSAKHSARRRRPFAICPAGVSKRNFRRSLAATDLCLHRGHKLRVRVLQNEFCNTNEICSTYRLSSIQFFFRLGVFVTYHSE